MAAGGVGLLFAVFVGCGENAGNREYEKAMEAWKDGDLGRARALLETSIRKTSGNEKKSIALNQLGLILWELDETDAAADAFSESCNFSESLTGANLNLGIALYHAGRYDEAEVALNDYLTGNPDNRAVQILLGLLKAEKQNWAGASKEIAEVVTADPRNPAALNALALSELHSHGSDAALTRLKRLVSTNPDYAPALYNIAAIYDFNLNNKKSALSWYKQYVSEAGENASHAALAKASIARLGGQAETSTASSESETGGAQKHITAGSNLYSAGKYAAAALEFKEAARLEPELKEAYYNMGLCYFNLKNYPESTKAFVSAVKLSPNNKDARYNLALSYYYQQLWVDAEREAKTLKRLDDPRGDQMLQYIATAKKQ